jgi:cysteine-rich repeat protein
MSTSTPTGLRAVSRTLAMLAALVASAAMAVSPPQRLRTPVQHAVRAVVASSRTCGNGVVEPPEACDDGNAADGDGCDASCLASICVAGSAMRNARLVVRGLGEPFGDERILFRGELPMPPGSPSAAAVAAAGLQTLLEDARFPAGFGMNGALDFHARDGNPVPPGPPGTGCGPEDGWRIGRKVATYLNRSGAIDPPDCRAGSARGLWRIRLVDARAKGGGIRFRIETRGSTVGDPVAPLRAALVLGADARTGAAGACAMHLFTADDCRIAGPYRPLRCG